MERCKREAAAGKAEAQFAAEHEGCPLPKENPNKMKSAKEVAPPTHAPQPACCQLGSNGNKTAKGPPPGHMDIAMFETRIVSIFNDRKYVFFDELQKGGRLKQMSDGHFAGLLAVGALVGFGAFMINRSDCTDSEIKSELVKLGALCDLIGINVATGSVGLVLFVYSDDLTDEAMVGKCQLIYGRLKPFKKFTMRIGWNKMPVSAKVFFVFSSSEKAFHFRTSVQEHCKRHSLFSKLWVLPWGVDLSAKSVWAYQGLPINWLKPKDIEAKIFS